MIELNEGNVPTTSKSSSYLGTYLYKIRCYGAALYNREDPQIVGSRDSLLGAVDSETLFLKSIICNKMYIRLADTNSNQIALYEKLYSRFLKYKLFSV